jgi:hypothetical protein
MSRKGFNRRDAEKKRKEEEIHHRGTEDTETTRRNGERGSLC